MPPGYTRLQCDQCGAPLKPVDRTELVWPTVMLRCTACATLYEGQVPLPENHADDQPYHPYFVDGGLSIRSYFVDRREGFSVDDYTEAVALLSDEEPVNLEMVKGVAISIARAKRREQNIASHRNRSVWSP